MRLHGVEVSWLSLALRRPVGTSAGTHRSRPVVIVRVDCEDAQGWGECGALAEGTLVDPPVHAVWSALVGAGAGAGAARLLAASEAKDGELPEVGEVAGLYGSTAVARMVAATVEMAVLDAELVASGTRLAPWLGAERGAVPAGGVVGIPADRSLGSLLDAVEALVAGGLRRVRLKIGPGWDIEPVAAVRRRYPELDLQVDANGAYRRQGSGEPSVDRLAPLDEHNLICIEQPLPPTDLPSHAELAERMNTPICLDESLTTPRSVVEAIGYGACEVACIKPARLGGLLAAREVQETCAVAGVPAFVGGFFETGLGRSANSAVAGLSGFSLPGDLTDPADYLLESPWGYPALDGGMVEPAEWAGVGGDADTEMLARLAWATERFERAG